MNDVTERQPTASDWKQLVLQRWLPVLAKKTRQRGFSDTLQGVQIHLSLTDDLSERKIRLVVHYD